MLVRMPWVGRAWIESESGSLMAGLHWSRFCRSVMRRDDVLNGTGMGSAALVGRQG